MKLGFPYSTVALFGIATGGLHPLVSLELVGLGEREIVVGLVTAAFYLGAFLGALASRSAAARWGYRRSLIALAVTAAVSTAALAAVHSWQLWLVLRLIAGLALGGYYVIVEGWILRVSPLARRSRNLAGYESVRLVAVASGPLALSMAAVSGFLVGGAAMLLAALPVLAEKGAPAATGEAAGRMAFGLLLESPAGLAACLMAGVYAGAFNGLGAVFAGGVGLSSTAVLLFMSVVLLAPVLTQLPLGALADRLGRRWTLLAVPVGAAFVGTMLASGLVTHGAALVVLAALFGGLCYPLYALGVGLVSESLEPADTLAGTGIANIAYSVGAIGGPVIAAALMASWGPLALYAFLACAVLAVAALLLATTDRACLRPGCCAAPT